MGSILSSFSKGNDSLVPDLNLDLEKINETLAYMENSENPYISPVTICSLKPVHATPTQEEFDLHKRVSSLLQPTDTLLNSLRNYQGCGELIRKAISNPTPENEEEAWKAVQPAVAKLKQYYEYSVSLEGALPELLNAFCEGNVRKNIEKFQALTKLLADILDFAFEFDYLKMRTPSIQNDFSYYRRTLSRGKLANEINNNHQTDLKTAMIEDELATQISLFYAYPTTMLKKVTDVTAGFVDKNNLGKSVSECLSGLAAACYHSVTKKRVQRPEMVDFCLRVMVVSIILYDHIDPQVKAIQTHGINEYTNLMSALRYNTKHLNDDSTPKNVKQLLSGH
ncbi:7298_t:CDS:2 [Funneliformis geosporum]|nr:7298_t:CDS:2 [Funneliformis geosporum]